jgi:hypothetical protein
MKRILLTGLLTGGLLMAGGQEAEAQEAGAGLLEVGAMAPDFALPGATRYGELDDLVRLSDYEGETVVLAFFFRVRTRG